MQTRCLRQLIAASVLGGYTLLGTALVALIYDITAERIEENQRLALLRQLSAAALGKYVHSIKGRGFETFNLNHNGSSAHDLWSSGCDGNRRG